MSRKAIGEKGRELADQFAKRLTLERVGNAERVKAEFEILSGKALDYRRKAGLGVFGTSQLVNNFQWRLVELGYAEEFSRQIGNQLAINLAATDARTHAGGAP